MNLLFAIDDNFVQQLETVLLSIHLNTKSQEFNIYVLQKKRLAKEAELAAFCKQLKMTYHPVMVKQSLFENAPVTDRYPTTIYYRLLAHQMLPQALHKILYLDADILCINDLSPLYNTALGNNLFASAIHASLTNTTDVINKIRLQNFGADGYYNSGVLLMNLDLMRQEVDANQIFDYIRRHILLLPDQDVLNALYSERIKTIPDQLYNFDTRNGKIYETISLGEWDLDWVIKNTVILHYCGREKPWLPTKNSGRLTALYKQYFHMTAKLQSSLQD
ncbi:glycosyltransferase family 8 protein [Limosilactobacillus urinaemulieris]|uniref:glycosyltransferase family 8 protein n=1 Tax=Limosilactobacillus urinaemulieris TaxID=2742600 RepID=UPI0024BAD233|nr:glycosyltransferase family 8 protein [Limosilactobacillus urinaemulieris]MCR5525709.1 glycosyltransferase family 8 protein [Lactobacillus sp.]